jgi:hypothetical protein
MTVMNIHSDTPIIYYDESLKAHLTLIAELEVEADVNEEYQKSTVQMYALNVLTDMLREYQRTVPFEGLSGKYGEISSAISEKLTAKMQFQCTARLIGLKPDEKSAGFLKTAAEMKRLNSFTSDCVPPFNGNKELMEKITGGMLSDDRSYKPNEPRNMGLTGMTPPGNNMSAYRPKFCRDCGTPLSPTAKFCGNCGRSVM